MANHDQPNRFSEHYTNLANPRLGAKVISVTDDFFAAADRMLKEGPAEFIPGKFDDNGKWMDGWESRRKRDPGYDHCVVKLGLSGVIHGVNIDTSHFCGNHPPAASIDACLVEGDEPRSDAEWVEILPSVELGQDSEHLHDITDQGVYSHLRLNIYPDGGVARFRVYGEPFCDWQQQDENELIDLFAVEHAGRAVAASNQGFGSSMHSLNLPGRGVDMGDGWETARRRTGGNDWVILKLGHLGVVKQIELDTAFYKGNYPDRAMLQAAAMGDESLQEIIQQSEHWPVLLPEQKLQADAIHRYKAEIQELTAVTHVRVNIIPDGGLSRVRLFGNKVL